MDTADRDALVLANLPLVGYLVADLCKRADHLSREDLASVGTLGLIAAAANYDAERGVPFGSYARRRIIGALVDELRQQDWASRSERRRMNEAKRVQETLTDALGRPPTVAEVADAMGVDTAAARAALEGASRRDESLDADGDMGDRLVHDGPTPEDEMLAREQTLMVRQAVASLPPRLRRVVEEIYFKGRSVSDVAKDDGLSYSSISHARAEAVRMLREGLATHYPDGEPAGPDAGATGRRKEYLETLGTRTAGGLTREDGPDGRMLPAS